MALITTSIPEDLGVIYDFELVGDTLPVHVHTADRNHITVVARGAIECLGDPAIAGKIHEAGAVIFWPANQEHGFKATVDKTRLVQLPRKGG